MITIARGVEPGKLRSIRRAELARLAGIKGPTGEDVGDKYAVVAEDLWRAQHYKCCYCELKLHRHYNDVEHRRPKGRADRLPGSRRRHGYWWLAFTWNNLFFACPVCNRSNKNDQFPLEKGSVVLVAQQRPPGQERPLFLDVAKQNGVEHIEFVLKGGHWLPRARGKSAMGRWTIRVCGIDQHVELYDDHVRKAVEPLAGDLEEALRTGHEVDATFKRALRLLQPSMPFVGLSYDALRHLVPDRDLAPRKLAWPLPRDVGRPPAGTSRRA